MQPLMTVDRQVVCFFMRSHKDTNLDLVVFVNSEKRREEITRLHSLRQRRIERRLHVELRIGTSDIRFVNLRQITGSPARLRIRKRIAHAQRHGFIAIVNTHRAYIRRGDRFRTWRGNATRTNKAILHDERQSYFIGDGWIDDAVWIGYRFAIGSDAGASLVSKLEISKLKHELAVTVRRGCL